ncbi:MAG: PIN/TRAM domain-containing protein [Peptococcaceae bacterium]
MIKKLVRVGIGLACAAGGLYLGYFTSRTFALPANNEIKIALMIFPGIILGLIGFSIAPRIIRWVLQMTGWIEGNLQKMPIQDLLGGAIGLIIGLIIATFIGNSFSRIPFVGSYIPIFASLLLGYIGMSVGAKKKEDLLGVFSVFKFGTKDKTNKNEAKPKHKILDTSVIIDGRIADICKTGFVEGPLVIPNFVLEELRHIADSSDVLKRNRGRRGLDILNKIRKELDIAVQISNMDFDDIAEVDSKLVKLAQVLEGFVVTNDYNLNKVAELQGVRVLNINELANAIKPVVLPGEEMIVQIIKDGKESGQGVAYLDDGTMIVVENGRRMIGETVNVLVTSVLQTAAGRMIFAKVKEERRGLNEVEGIV